MVTLQAAIAAIAISGFGQTVLLDFYADWCAPCRAMNPTVDALIAAGYPVERVNLDQNRPLAAKYGVQSIPCFVMLVDGRVVDRVEGGTTYSRLERMCKTGASTALPSPAAIPSQDNAPSDRYIHAPVAVFPRGTQPPAWPNTQSPAAPPSALSAPFEDRVISAVANQPASVPPTAAVPAITDAALLAASVRVRVEDHDGHSCGSGTIIDARGDKALVLTCGHLFCDSQGKGRITVDLFTSGGPEQVVGEWISYDLTRDVGLVVIHPSHPVTTARLAPPGYRLTRGMSVASVGCNNGGPPTVLHSQVTFLDKFQGPPTVEVSGQPVKGRSGGGLFSSEGYVIGVCNAADPSDKEGLFAALASVYAQLDQEQMSFVYNSPSENPAADVAVVNAAATIAAPPAPVSPPAMGVPTELAALGSPPTAAAAPSAGLPPQQQATLEEIRRRLKEGADVVVIVRPRGNPDARCEVIMLDHASPEFVKQLAAEGRLCIGLNDRPCPPTSLKEPPAAPTSSEASKAPSKPHQVLLEWSAPNGAAASNPTR